jgi:predicted nucleic acid-binding protein
MRPAKTLRFLDTNILLRYFTRDDEERASRALALLLF